MMILIIFYVFIVNNANIYRHELILKTFVDVFIIKRLIDCIHGILNPFSTVILNRGEKGENGGAVCKYEERRAESTVVY